MKSSFLSALGLVSILFFSSCEQKHPYTGGTEGPKQVEVDPPTDPTPPYFIHLSDVHLDSFRVATDYGEDTGMELWGRAKSKLEEVLSADPAPQFLVYTGDLPAHYDCGPTSCYLAPKDREQHNTNISTILNEMRDLVDDNGIPLLYMPGNNDALAGDYYSFADKDQNTPLSLVSDPEFPYPAINANTPCGDPPCMVSDPHPTMGYYSARPIDGLRIISLNSIILGRYYLPVDGVSQLEAGNQQLDWLEAQLEDAAGQGEAVYIAMHIPPGNDAYAVSHDKTETWMWAKLPDTGDTWLDQFLGMTAKYDETIAGMLYGHTHMDELRRLYDPEDGSLTEVAISAPGITPNHYNNPGFKTVWYDAESKELLDFETFYSTPTATEWGDASYKFSEIFDCPDGISIYDCLTARSLEEVNEDMDSIYTVMHGAPSYDTESGIEVKAGE